MPKTKTPTIEDARQAVELLAQYGRSRFCESASHSHGQCIGIAVSACTDSVVDAAVEMLEDWNYHLCVAAIGAIQQGQGTVQREGRHLSIELPEHWANL